VSNALLGGKHYPCSLYKKQKGVDNDAMLAGLKIVAGRESNLLLVDNHECRLCSNQIAGVSFAAASPLCVAQL